MDRQHRFTAPAVVTSDVGRVLEVTLRAEGGVAIQYAIGVLDGDNVFQPRERHSVLIGDETIPGPVKTVILNMMTRAMTLLINRGYLPAGVDEAIPAVVVPPAEPVDP